MVQHETPELDAVVATLDEAGFFDAIGIPAEAYRFADIVFTVRHAGRRRHARRIPGAT